MGTFGREHVECRCSAPPMDRVSVMVHGLVQSCDGSIDSDHVDLTGIRCMKMNELRLSSACVFVVQNETKSFVFHADHVSLFTTFVDFAEGSLRKGTSKSSFRDSLALSIVPYSFLIF